MRAPQRAVAVAKIDPRAISFQPRASSEASSTIGFRNSVASTSIVA